MGKRTDADTLAREKDKRRKAEKKARREEERADQASRQLDEREDNTAAAFQFSQAYYEKASENQHLMMKIEALENDYKRQYAENEEAIANLPA